MSFFGMLGKYLAESGDPHLLTESRIIETGSLTSVLSGKSYKRCKRIHQLLALAMELDHFSFFRLSLEDKDIQTITSMEDNLASTMVETETSSNVEHIEEFLTGNSKGLIKKYEKFMQNTQNAFHGKIVQYWIGYVDMVHLYHEFSRSIRTGDLELYIYCLQRLAALFFTFNHHNYARWRVVYLDNLLKLPEKNPEIYQEFKNGCFSLKGTSKSFPRLPIDLTL